MNSLNSVKVVRCQSGQGIFHRIAFLNTSKGVLLLNKDLIKLRTVNDCKMSNNRLVKCGRLEG